MPLNSNPTTQALSAEGDLVAVRETSRATRKGPFQGVLPTGKRIYLSGIDVDRIENGKMVEQRIEQDLLRLLQQLDAPKKWR